MDKKIIEASELPDNVKVYLKKDWTGWRVVEPIRSQDGKLLWKRILFGTTKERVFLGFILLIIVLGYLGFQEQINNYKKVMDNPCAYCNSCQEQTRSLIRDIQSKDGYDNFGKTINFSGLG